MTGKLIAGVLGGLLPAAFGAGLVTLATLDIQSGESEALKGFLVFWVIGFMAALFAARPTKAWSRILIVAGILALALPVASMVFTTRAAPDAAALGSDYAATASAGTALEGQHTAVVMKGTKYVGRIITYMAGFLGMIFGAVFITLGVLVGLAKPAAGVESKAAPNK